MADAARHPLRHPPYIVLTPQIGFVPNDNDRAYSGGTVEGIKAWLEKAPIRILPPMQVG